MKKITLKAFFESKENLVVHFDTKEKVKKFRDVAVSLKYNNIPCKSDDAIDYLWDRYEDEICFSNDGYHSSLAFYEGGNYTIYEFEDIDLEN